MKIKVTVTVTREIEINRSYYPEGHTDKQILADEIQFSENLFHEWIQSDNVTYKHEGKIIEPTE